MSLLILETDMVTLFQHNHPKVIREVQARSANEVAITVLTVLEQLSGWYDELRRAKKPARLAAVYERMARTTSFLGRLQILTFSESAIRRWQSLKKLKLNIGKMDLRIAAIALEIGATVVTRNVSDFGRVPGLSTEDWSQ